MNCDDFCRRAAVVRAVPLETVLLFRGAVRDRHDRRKWHTEQGPLSVTGAKFMNWQRGQGGGGAIDLVMHLAGVDFRTAMAGLEQNLAASPLVIGEPTAHAPGGNNHSRELFHLSRRPTATSMETQDSPRGHHAQHGRDCPTPPSPERPGRLWLPVPDDRMLGRVRQYLTRRRYLSASLIEPLVQSGRLYADSRGNAVFLLLTGKAQRPVGAELRGTGPRVWRGMAPGTRKDLGYFWIGAPGSREIVLCESAIDAISCFQIHPQRICISTSGVRSDPPRLHGLIVRGYELHCGFDADDPGDAAAARMITLHPAVRRLRPPTHDWNDALASSR